VCLLSVAEIFGEGAHESGFKVAKFQCFNRQACVCFETLKH